MKFNLKQLSTIITVLPPKKIITRVQRNSTREVLALHDPSLIPCTVFGAPNTAKDHFWAKS